MIEEKTENPKPKDDWDYEMQRRYGYTFRHWEEYKPWK